MEKTVLTGDRLLVNKFLYAPFAASAGRALLPGPRRAPRRRPRLPVSRRTRAATSSSASSALPGETVAIRDRAVSIDGRRLEEPYVFHADDRVWPDDPDVPDEGRRRDQLAPLRVPEAPISSWETTATTRATAASWGPVPAGHLVGRALFVYWSIAPRPTTRRRRPRSPRSATRSRGRGGTGRFFRCDEPANRVRIDAVRVGGKGMTRSRRGIRGGANFGCIVWLVVLGLVAYLLWKVVPVKIATSEFYDVMQEQAAFGSIKDPKFIEFEILQEGRRAQAPDQEGEPQDHQAARRDHRRGALRDHDRLLQRGLQVPLEVRSGGHPAALRGLSGSARGGHAARADRPVDLRGGGADRDPGLDAALLRAGAARALPHPQDVRRAPALRRRRRRALRRGPAPDRVRGPRARGGPPRAACPRGDAEALREEVERVRDSGAADGQALRDLAAGSTRSRPGSRRSRPGRRRRRWLRSRSG